jgi:hypothetical protein
MSPSFKHAVYCAIVASIISACDVSTIKENEKPVATIRLQLDAERNRVWLLTREGVAIYDAGMPDRIRRISIPNWIFVGPPRGCLPDIALGPRGEAVVSSDVVPVLWRIDPETLAVTLHELQVDTGQNRGIGFTVLRYVPARRAYLGIDRLRGTIWRIDGDLKRAHIIALDIPRTRDCSARDSKLLREIEMLY